MPGVLIIEAMAQACASWLLPVSLKTWTARTASSTSAGIDNARFKRVVQPGDQLVIEGRFIRQ